MLASNPSNEMGILHNPIEPIGTDNEDNNSRDLIDNQELDEEIVLLPPPEEDYKNFVEAFKRCPHEDGKNVITTIGTLPSINNILGRGHTYTRLLKFCVSHKLLDKEKYEKKTAYTKLTKAELVEFHNCAIEASEDERTFALMCRVILDPFRAEISKLTSNVDVNPTSTNNFGNKIALLAWLVVSDSATSIWEELQKEVDPNIKPQLLDQMNGINGWKTKLFEKLCSVGEAIKLGSEIDFSLFDENHIGTEAAAAMAHFSPGQATLDPAWLKTNYTAMVNLHDQLLSNLDCSGSSTPAGTIDRRIRCFNNFLGPEGKVKNLPLFYCFVVWEDAVVRRAKDIRWLSRTLTTGRPSLLEFNDNNMNRSNVGKSRDEFVLSKKDAKTVFMMKQIMSPMTPISGVGSMISSGMEACNNQGPELPSLLEKRKAEYMEQLTKQAITQQMKSVMENPDFFCRFSTEQQNQITERFMNSLLG